MAKICPACKNAPLPNFNMCERCLTSFGRLVLPTDLEDLKKARQCLRRRTRSGAIVSLGSSVTLLVVFAVFYHVFMIPYGISLPDVFFFWINEIMGGGIWGYAFTIFAAVFFVFMCASLIHGTRQDWQDVKRISATLKSQGIE